MTLVTSERFVLRNFVHSDTCNIRTLLLRNFTDESIGLSETEVMDLKSSDITRSSEIACCPCADCPSGTLTSLEAGNSPSAHAQLVREVFFYAFGARINMSFGSLNLSNAVLSPKRYRRTPKSQEVGEERDYT